MSDESIRILIEAVDKASANITAIDDRLKNVEKSAAAASKGGLKGLGKSLDDTMRGLTGISLASLTAAGAVVGMAKVIGDSVRDYSAYVESIDKASQFTGIQADELSRLIQVGDDFRVSQEAITNAMGLALKNGFNPTTENLADLADELKGITDPTDRASKLTEIFGRQWKDVYPLLSRGGDAIRDAADGISDSLVVTEDAIVKNRKYVEAQDKLNDSWTAIKNNLAKQVIPVWGALVGALADVIEKTDEMNNGNRDLLKDAVYGSKTYEEYASKIREYAEAHNLVIDSYGNIRIPGGRVIEMNGLMDESAWKLAQSQQGLNEMVAQGVTHFGDLSGAIQQVEVEGVKNLQTAMDELTLFMAGPLGKENEKYAQQQSDLKDKMTDLGDEIRELEGKSWLPADDKEKLKDLKGQLGELRGEYGLNATAHEEASKRILYDLLQQKLMVDGVMDQDDLDILTTAASNWGLIDDATMQAYQKMVDYVDQEKQGIISAGDLDDKIAGIPNRTITLTINEMRNSLGSNGLGYSKSTGSGDQEGYASGGSFVIPPGYPNDSYPLAPGKWGQSGETVTVTPAGKSPSAQQPIVNNFYINNQVDTVAAAYQAAEIVERRLIGG